MTIQFDEAEVMKMAWNQALDALRSLARGEADVVYDDDGEPTGVRWPTEDGECMDSISWGE